LGKIFGTFGENIWNIYKINYFIDLEKFRIEKSHVQTLGLRRGKFKD
jgi:hypothetical protein